MAWFPHSNPQQQEVTVTLTTGNFEAGESPKTEAKLLTTSEACEYIWGEFTPTTKIRLYRAYQSGKIKSCKLSGRHWWPLSELVRLIETPTDWQGNA